MSETLIPVIGQVILLFSCQSYSGVGNLNILSHSLNGKIERFLLDTCLNTFDGRLKDERDCDLLSTDPISDLCVSSLSILTGC